MVSGVLLCVSSSCVPYVASFSGLSFLIASSVFSNVYLSVSLDYPLLIASSVFSNVYLSVSLDCPLLIASSVFSNVYLSCASYVTSFSGLSFVGCFFGIL